MADIFFKYFYPLFHVLGANKISIGKISNLPINITPERSILEKGEYAEKLDIGPIKFIPGPTLFKQVMAAVKFEVKS